MATTKVRRKKPKYRKQPWSKYVLMARARHERDLKRQKDKNFPYYYDEAAADRAVRFFQKLRHFDGEWNGKPFILSDWQEFDIVRPLFGWKRKSNGFRRYRYAYIEIARKNGKSPLAAGIALYLQIADREPGAQVYCAATKESQARIVWEYAKKMILASPYRDEVEPYKSSIYNPAMGSVFVPLGRDSRTQDGFSVHGAIIDEYHAHKTSEMLNVLESGRGARRQPLILIITTAGHENGGPCKAESNRMKKLLRGELENDEIFAFIATVDDESKWREEEEWWKANPNLEVSVYLEGLRSDYKATVEAPDKANEFQVKNLNIWKENITRWIKASSYNALDVSPVNLDELKGKRCFCALDLGVSQDISAFSMAFYMNDPKPGEELPEIVLVNKYWVPRDNIRERYLNDGVIYPDWVSQGWLKATDGPTTRYDVIRKDINDLASMFDIAEIAVDQAHAAQLMVQLQDDGLTVFKHSQGMMAMSFGTKSLQELILNRKLRPGNDPVFRWMILNTVVFIDPNGNIKPLKNKSEEKIDGVVSSAMAIGRLLIAPEPQNFVYNKRRGIFVG